MIIQSSLTTCLHIVLVVVLAEQKTLLLTVRLSVDQLAMASPSRTTCMSH